MANMKQINRKSVPFILRPLAPNYWAAGVRHINFEELSKKHGVRAVAFDIDSTLVEHNGAAIDTETLKQVQKAQKQKRIQKIALATNRQSLNFAPLVKQLGKNTVVIHGRGIFDSKPSKRYFSRLIRELDIKPQEILMVGDKAFTDILGGNRSGLRTLHVDRLGPNSWFDKILPFRYIERYIMRSYHR